MAKLVVLNKGSSGTSFELKAERNTVGRVEENDLAIPESSISSRHCEIYVKGDEVRVKDLGSTNGTFIDGNPVTEGSEGTLKGGQVLRLGQVELKLEGVEGAAAQKQTPASKGIKPDQLEFGNRPQFESTSMFSKRSDKANKVFVTVGITLGIIVVGLLIYGVFLLMQARP